MTDSQQAVTTDPNLEETPAVNPTGQENGVQNDDLDTLLNEYAASETQKLDDKKDKPKAISPEEIEYIRQRKLRDQADSINNDIKSAVTIAKGESDLPDNIVEGFLHQKVASDPRMMKAWEERASKPGEWSKVLKTAGTEFTQSVEEYIANRNNSSNSALASAVHSAKTQVPSGNTPGLGELTRMSAQEFERAKMGS